VADWEQLFLNQIAAGRGGAAVPGRTFPSDFLSKSISLMIKGDLQR